MSRLGAKRTVKGYLDRVASLSLLGDLDKQLPDTVRSNWETILGTLPKNWLPQSLISKIRAHCSDIAWGDTHQSRRTPLGREEIMIFCQPSVIDLVHSDLEHNAAPDWVERALSFQIWECVVRAGKAKLHILPTRLIGPERFEIFSRMTIPLGTPKGMEFEAGREYPPPL